MIFQFEDRINQLQTFFDLLKAGYVNDKPLHVADPETSLFDVISFTDFERLSTTQIQNRLRCKHIVVTGCEGSNIKFDEAGLRTLCPLNRTTSLQGMNPSFLS